MNLYGGNPGGRTTYILRAETPPGSESAGTPFEIRRSDILRTEWEEGTGASFDPTAATGLAIGLSTPATERIAGTIRPDDLGLIGAPASAPSASPIERPPAGQEAPVDAPTQPCSSVLLLPLLPAGLALFRRGR